LLACRKSQLSVPPRVFNRGRLGVNTLVPPALLTYDAASLHYHAVKELRTAFHEQVESGPNFVRGKN